jgi:hypothetical protein
MSPFLDSPRIMLSAVALDAVLSCWRNRNTNFSHLTSREFKSHPFLSHAEQFEGSVGSSSPAAKMTG